MKISCAVLDRIVVLIRKIYKLVFLISWTDFEPDPDPDPELELELEFVS